MKKKLYIFGCSGIGKSICDSIAATTPTRFDVICFVDTKANQIGRQFYGNDTVAPDEIRADSNYEQVAIFSYFKPADIFRRERQILEQLSKSGLKLITVIDRNAWVAPTATVGDGCYIAPGAVIDSDAVIGRNSIVLFNTVVSREVELAPSTFLSAGCVLKGSVRIRESSFVSAGSIITKDVRANCFISAGVTLTEEVTSVCVVGKPKGYAIVPLPEDRDKAEKRLSFFHP